MANTNYKQTSFAPLLRQFNNHDGGGDDWMDHVELYGLKFLAYDENFKIYSAIDSDHSHSLWEIHLMQKGRQNYLINGENHVLEAGEFLLIYPGTMHYQTFENEPFSKFSLLMRLPVDSELLPTAVLERIEQDGCIKAKTSHAMNDILNYLFENVGLGDHDSVANLQSCVSIFLRAVAKRLQEIYGVEHSVELQSKPERSNDAEFCERVLAYIKDNVSDILSAKEVADHFFISSRHLNRKLQGYYGKSYCVIADKIRGDYARDLLCFSSISVEEVATRLGYSNTSNFIRFFKRVEGQSPTNFRRGFHEMNHGHI